MIHPVRVIFGDTDMMGVVYYANYLRYFEGARAAWFRDIGRSYTDLSNLGIGFPVTEAQCRYRRPAFYEDALDIDVRVTQVKGASIRFEYRITREDELLATGFTVHACVGERGRPQRIPQELAAEIRVEPSA